VRALPESAAFLEVAVSNLAHRAALRFASRGHSNAQPNITALIRPLIPDLIQNASRFEMNTKGAQDADWMLAIKLPDARSKSWSKSLAELATLTELKGASADTSKWTASGENYKLSFSRAKDWTIIEGGFGEPDSKTSKSFRDGLGKRSGKTVLDAEVNAPLLGKIWGASNLAHYPKLTVKAEPKNDGFQSELLLDYPQDLGIKPEKWNVPKELISDPLISFTAIQGVRKKLESMEKFRALGAEQTPNQIFAWAQSISPFSVHLAAEVGNPAQVVTNAARVLGRIKAPVGSLQLATNRTAFLWTGLPIVVPFLEPAPAPRDSFISAGLFPVKLQDAKAAPAELLEQLNQKNLVYYDWEITGNRLKQWIPAWQLYYLVGQQFTPVNFAPGSKFLQALKPQLGNTVTAGTLENPRQIKFIRQSHVGATSLELLLLAHYLDTTDLTAMPGGANRPTTPAIPAPTAP
jgi:hypothetical protein